MMQIVNLNNNIEKELELERQGMRRTRRWIGDANQAADARWYQARAYRISSSKRNLDEVSRVAKKQPHREAQGSILDRLSGLMNTRRQPAGSKS